MVLVFGPLFGVCQDFWVCLGHFLRCLGFVWFLDAIHSQLLFFSKVDPPQKKIQKRNSFFSKTKMFFMVEICIEKLFWVPRPCLDVFFLLFDEAMCLAYFGISKSLKNIKNHKIVKTAQDRMCRSQKTSNSDPNTKKKNFWLIWN